MARKKSAAKKAREAAAIASITASSLSTESIQKPSADLEVTNKPKAPASFELAVDKNNGVISKSESDFSGSESSDEEEDEFGELVTEDIEEGINNVLKTIRENPKALLNKEVQFFKEVEESENNGSEKKDKPVYLKDYHRMNLLEGANDIDENGERPFAIQQQIDKEKLVAEIHGALDDNEDDEDGDFLTKRSEEREVKPLDLPDPTQDENKFLQAFFDSKAWLPKTIDKKTGKPVLPSYGEIVEDDEEFDDDAEKFETAYNFRFEDPNAAEIVSYARNQNTLRRKEESGRKKQREAKISAKKEAEAKHETEITKVKNKKVKEVVTKFEQLKKALGDDEESEALSKLLEAQDLDNIDFEGDEWDRKMQEVFNEEFYSRSASKPKEGKDSDDEEGEEEGEEDAYDDNNAEEDLEDAAQEGDEQVKSKSKQKREEKKKKKLESLELQQKAQKLVEENIDLILEKEGLVKKDDAPKFKYRDVEPDSFGLSARDILLANDTELNEYVGLKKLATYRDDDKRKKDHRKYAKKRRLREWRKSVFDTEDEPTDEAIIEILQGKGNKRSASNKKLKPKKKQKKN